MEAGNVYFATYEDTAVLKFVGPIRYTMGDSYRVSTALDAFLDRLFGEGGFKHLLIDLTQAESIDSTNLGLLAKAKNLCQEQLGETATIISTNPDINAVLQSVGFDQVFNVIEQPAGEVGKMEPVPEAPKPEKELVTMMLEAHTTLSEMSEENAQMFRNVVELLEKRSKEGGQG
jgi:anti-anti-sigma factor